MTQSNTEIRATLVSPDKEMISPLLLMISLSSETTVRVKITDPNNERYEVPFPDPEFKTKDNVTGNSRYKVMVNEAPFSIQISRVESGRVIFDTAGRELVFQNQLLSLGIE